MDDIQRFKTLTYKDFQDLAKDDSLSPYQKIGFPNSYREGKEWAIWEDILQKMPALQKKGTAILDIGCGCSDLVTYIVAHCEAMQQTLILVDSAEMLDLVPDAPHVVKIVGRFPDETPALLKDYAEKIDGILTYSVFHYIFVESNFYLFIEQALSLLCAGGQFLIGDIPNVSRRKRFFATKTGIAYHQDYTKSDSLPPAFDFATEADQIDDGVIFGILLRYRNIGYESYLLPQAANLPMANRREDILIAKV